MPVACHQTGNACQRQEFQEISYDANATIHISNIFKIVTEAARGLLQIMRMTATAAVTDIKGDKTLGYHKLIKLNRPVKR